MSSLKNKIDTRVTQPMLSSPKTFKDNMNAALDDFRFDHMSISQDLNDYSDWDETVTGFNELFPGANIPHPTDFYPESDMTFEQQYDEMVVNSVFGTGTIPMSFEEKTKYVQNKIDNYLSTVDSNDERLTEYKPYEYYKDLTKKEAFEKKATYGLYQEYAEGAWAKWGGGLTGNLMGALNDPVIAMTIPLSIVTGGSASAGWVANGLRIGAIEALLAGGSQAIVETQVLPYQQELGFDYSIKNSIINVVAATVTGGTLPIIIGGSIKGTQVVYKSTRDAMELQLSKINPSIKNKIIGRKLNELVDDKEWLEQFSVNLKTLTQLELREVIEQLTPDSSMSKKTKEVIDEMDQAIDDALENPFDNTPEGIAQHQARLLEAEKAIRFGKQLDLLEPEIEVKIKPGKKTTQIEIDNASIYTQEEIKLLNQIKGIKNISEKINKSSKKKKTKQKTKKTQEENNFNLNKKIVDIEEKVKIFDNPKNPKIEKLTDDDLEVIKLDQKLNKIDPKKRIAVGEEEMTVKELLDEVDQDKSTLNRLKDCII